MSPVQCAVLFPRDYGRYALHVYETIANGRLVNFFAHDVEYGLDTESADQGKCHGYRLLSILARSHNNLTFTKSKPKGDRSNYAAWSGRQIQ